MKITRTTKVVLLTSVCFTLLVAFPPDSTMIVPPGTNPRATLLTNPPKARAGRLNLTHNIVTKPIAVPSASAQPNDAPSIQERP